VDVSIDAAELDGMSEEELRRKYDAHSRGSAGVPGSREDFSDFVAKEVASRSKKQKEKERDSKKGKEFKF
jgi:splicing factor 3B subunit 2